MANNSNSMQGNSASVLPRNEVKTQTDSNLMITDAAELFKCKLTCFINLFTNGNVAVDEIPDKYLKTIEMCTALIRKNASYVNIDGIDHKMLLNDIPIDAFCEGIRNYYSGKSEIPSILGIFKTHGISLCNDLCFEAINLGGIVEFKEIPVKDQNVKICEYAIHKDEQCLRYAHHIKKNTMIEITKSNKYDNGILSYVSNNIDRFIFYDN